MKTIERINHPTEFNKVTLTDEDGIVYEEYWGKSEYKIRIWLQNMVKQNKIFADSAESINALLDDFAQDKIDEGISLGLSSVE